MGIYFGEITGEIRLNMKPICPFLKVTSTQLLPKVPKMEEFLGKRDYTGAMAVLEFNRHSGQGSEEVLTI